ncbi:DUF2470 domain-containing protein [Planosporangium flavigriseum]|uniref:DUF2470 domain-containing protein n=1 Tax=Planosporangium flavigriseum TaxID=373681 RepID=A0A8J3LMD5_9ACTN|nr:DUF2470 domain-containing protein [Planosporangium flavigriseum]NJC62963.1 DUF2470 domain-containing protein [Planosporangium flavigriseum]GIG73168.1 hypothetical protein Pfl04_15720 [Planosporangium flavigriseum]
MSRKPDPEPAERLRSLLVAASSLRLRTPGHHADLVGRHHVDDTGRLMLEFPNGSCLAQELLHQGELVAMIELTDVAPVAVRNRVRCRATLTGWLSSGDDPAVTSGAEQLAVLDLAAAELVEPHGATDIGPADFASARPDPLAVAEAELLCHLVDGHPQAIESLSRLVPPHRLHGVRRIQPVRLDRFGVVLRLEFASHDRDVRLPFANPLEQAHQAAERMRELLARAGRCRRSIGH